MNLPILPTGSAKTAAPSAPAGWPFLRLGFRPFYLGAALFAWLAIPLWVALYLGQVDLPLAVAPLLWHAHEMLFGFAAAVIVGFLLTAGKAWTGLATPRGAGLGALALLWLAARVAGVTGPYPVYAALDLLFLPLIATIFVTILLRAGNRRNLPLALMLSLLSAANLVFHLAAMRLIDIPPMAPLHAGLALIVMIECVMAGRVVPAFTMSATPGLKIRTRSLLERGSLLTTALALLLWIFAPRGAWTFLVFAVAAVLHLLRQWQWHPWVTRNRPILWVLHVAYAWIPVGLGLLAWAQIGAIGDSAGVHALAVGATGGLIIGMVTRTARGHTGRPLKVSTAEVLAYALVVAAAIVRVLLPLVAPQWTVAALVLAAAAWSAAFFLYCVVFTPWLMRTRADGKDG